MRHGRLLWLLALLAAIPATLRTAQLYANLRSEMEELLPPDAASVRAIDELRRRMRGLQFLGVIADVGEHASPARIAAAERFIDDLAARVRGYPGTQVGGVRTGFAAERAFVERHALVLLAPAARREVRERLDERLRWEFGQRAGTLIDDEAPAPPFDLSDLGTRGGLASTWSELKDDRFTNPRLGLSLMLIETAGFSTSAQTAAALVNRVERDVADLGGPAAYAPGMRVGFTGDVAISAEETQALVHDLTLSLLLVVGAVVLVLLLYFRWLPSVLVVGLPLLLATVFAFGLASLLGVTVINSNTAFLGSIIVGNGINYGIVQLARYLEERRSGRGVREALERSLWGTRAGTLSAALAAAVSYASLMAMQFRGFRQFGVIGGIGLALAWAASFVLGPPLIVWLDRKETLAAPTPLRRLGGLQPMARLAAWVARFPRAILLGSLAFTVLAVWQVSRFSHAQIEYDLARMRRGDTWTAGEGYWGRKMDRLLGQYLTPIAILTDGPAETRTIARALREAIQVPPMQALVAEVRTLDDLMPPDQAERLRDVEHMRRKLTANVRADLPAEQRRLVDTFLGQDAVKPITRAEIPETLLKGLQERDGRADAAVLVFPKLTADLWDGPGNAAFVAALRTIARLPEPTGGKPARVAGSLPLTVDVIASMLHDGPLASLLAFVGVVLAVLVLFRGRGASPFVLAALLLGVLWLLASSMALRIKLNFFNFVAFPITFGIGVDYAVNVMARFVGDGARDVGRAVRGTGGAVTLCSLTTIIGYSSLLMAKNLGLFYFGFLAVLGELTCLTAAVVVLPAGLLVWSRRTGRS